MLIHQCDNIPYKLISNKFNTHCHSFPSRKVNANARVNQRVLNVNQISSSVAIFVSLDLLHFLFLFLKIFFTVNKNFHFQNYSVSVLLWRPLVMVGCISQKLVMEF